ncbi:hypothetical protein BGZ76_000115 [Entomortierella beljakovae]|nr:hypothetical protein BGZ76_000115 [Entomortierella beljakovae]
MQSEKEFQVYFRTPEGRTIAIMLPADFTFEVFKKIGNEVMASRHDEIQGYYFAVSGRSISMENRKQFDGNKHLITKECNIFILGRLLGGRSFPDTLQEIVEQELKVEISKADTHTSECSICLDDDTNCVKVCCTWMCGEDFERWILDKQFKASCTVCSKAIHLGSIFKSAEFIATIQALQDERQLLKNIDCQRCLDCNALMHNETMLSHQTCIVCRREFCFFCNRKWDTAVRVPDASITVDMIGNASIIAVKRANSIFVSYVSKNRLSASENTNLGMTMCVLLRLSFKLMTYFLD